MEKRRILTLLWILIFLPITLASLGLNANYSTQQNKMEPFLYIQYTINSTFDIDNDTAFGPSGYNFPGSGIEGDPYIIAGMNITSNSANLIDISDTTKYFVINDNLLDGLNGNFVGISLLNVINGNVRNNTIQNSKNGVQLTSNSIKNYIYNNSIVNNGEYGIKIQDSDENFIFDNYIHGNGNNGGGGASVNIVDETFTIQNGAPGGGGLYLDPSTDNNITNNEIYNNSADGIYLFESNHTIIQKNNIYRNYRNGITINNSHHNIIDDNEIHDNGHNSGGGGASLAASEASLSIQNGAPGGGGLYLDPSTENNITNNNIQNNRWYGVAITTGSSINLIKCNNFIANNPEGTSQALDNGSANVFSTNYWSEWTSPDSDENGIVDKPYLIDGNANNKDEYPVTEVLQCCPLILIKTTSGSGLLIIITSILSVTLFIKLKSKDQD
jgi:parallel beta-helix repeat protein